MSVFPLHDDQYEECQVVSVERGSIGMSTGFHIGFPEEFKPQPQVGDTVRLYCRGIGFAVRGLFLNGKRVWYRTEEEDRRKAERDVADREEQQRVEFEANREQMDARFDALPSVFRERIDKFRRNNSEFRWKYEGYELFVCEEAVRIAEEMGSPDAVREFAQLPYDQQRERVVLSDGHSGNTFGMACRLAYLYLAEPTAVEQMYGALAPLVGSEEYGCVPRGEQP